MDYKGKHVTADVLLHTMPGPHALMGLCEQAIAQSGMQVVACTHKQFTPHGLTAVWILAESHFTLHSYPEHNYITVDCYTCGTEGDPARCVGELLAMLPVAQQQVAQHLRGALQA